MSSQDVPMGDGRVVRAYASGPAGDGPVVVWHHGSPQTGVLLAPLLDAAAGRGIRLVSFARPGYGGSTRRAGRTVAAVAGDVSRVADAFGVGRYAVMGASGGGPHALGCAAADHERVTAAVSLAGLAPFTDEFDWFGGMVGHGGLLAATKGAEARFRHADSAEFDENSFTDADRSALAGEWAALGTDAQLAGDDVEGHVDDDLAFVTPWGFDISAVTAPTLVVQGGQDRVVPPAHATWLTEHLPRATLWRRPPDGHVSVLRAVGEALDWLPR
nr:alpha/beta hydrolase [Actinophytocola xinjiangensis]